MRDLYDLPAINEFVSSIRETKRRHAAVVGLLASPNISISTDLTQHADGNHITVPVESFIGFLTNQEIDLRHKLEDLQERLSRILEIINGATT